MINYEKSLADLHWVRGAITQQSLYAYLSKIEFCGGQVDQYIPIVMSKMIGRKISIYVGKDVWHSDDHMIMDMTFVYIEGNFMPTKVGSAGC